MKRIVLFLATNLAILLVLSMAARLLGVDHWLTARGGDLGGLLVFAALFGFGGSLLSLAMSKWMAKRAMGVHVIDQPGDAAERWLVDTVRRQAQAAGIGMPEVGIFESPTPNAFATGMSRNHALVAVSTGLLRNMRREEVEAVLGHEVSHVANGDMVTLALIQGVVNTFVIFLARIVGGIVDRALFRSEEGRSPVYFVTVLVAELVEHVAANPVHARWLKRLARDPHYNRNLRTAEGELFSVDDRTLLNWDPLPWHPLPRVLAHAADNMGCGQYRILGPMRALVAGRRVQGWTSFLSFGPAELDRLEADSLVFQRQITDDQMASKKVWRFAEEALVTGSGI